MSGLQPDGFSHSEICGSKVICTSPQLFAAYHVLHRLWEPRHPPYALFFFLVLRRHVPYHIIYKEGDTLSILSVLIPCHKKGQGTLYFRFSCFVSLCQRPCPEKNSGEVESHRFGLWSEGHIPRFRCPKQATIYQDTDRCITRRVNGNRKRR